MCWSESQPFTTVNCNVTHGPLSLQVLAAANKVELRSLLSAVLLQHAWPEHGNATGTWYEKSLAGKLADVEV